MRTKVNVMASLHEAAAAATDKSTISHLTDVSLLGVLIDIRDILDNRLLEIDRDIGKIVTTLMEVK